MLFLTRFCNNYCYERSDMKPKIREYIAKNMKDLITRCNFISCVLRWLIFCSFAIILVESIIAICIITNLEQPPAWLDLFLTILFRIPVYILIYSSKTYLIVIPFIWVILCWDCIKHKRNNKYVVSNLCLWLFIALITVFIYNSNKSEEECMKLCVLPDKSNYSECSLNTCDFLI